jgi:hypothetical protein
MAAQELESVMVFIVTLVHLGTMTLIFAVGHRIGKREGQKLEVRTMIELLDAIKIDSCDQRVFRDRFKAALQWVLDGKRKSERGPSE